MSHDGRVFAWLHARACACCVCGHCKRSGNNYLANEAQNNNRAAAAGRAGRSPHDVDVRQMAQAVVDPLSALAAVGAEDRVTDSSRSLLCPAGAPAPPPPSFLALTDGGSLLSVPSLGP